MIAWWHGSEHRIALALDATTLGQRFTVLTISVLYRGCVIPVAWQPEWAALLASLNGSIPPDWQMLVCADR